MIDLGALLVLHRVGQLGGIGAAARSLHISQPAVSQRLRKLESGLGKKLYGKAGRQLVFTEDGKRLYETSRRIFDILDSAEAALEGTEATLMGTVRLAAISEFSKFFMLPLILAFRKRHPSVEFDVQYRLPYEMLASLSRHEVDFAVSNEPYRRPQIELAPLFKERIVCVGAAPARRLSGKDIERATWLSYGAEDPLWHEFERLAARRRLTLPRPAVRIADIESVLKMAADGAGHALVPQHSFRLRKHQGLAVHGLPLPTMFKQIYFCRLKTVAWSPATRAFWEFVVSRRRDFARSGRIR